MPTSAASHAQTRARPDRKKVGQSARQSVASSSAAVTQRELPSVGVGPGRKPSIPGWQPGLGLGRLLALCGFKVPEALRAEDLGMISPEVSLSTICGDGRPLLSAL